MRQTSYKTCCEPGCGAQAVTRSRCREHQLGRSPSSEATRHRRWRDLRLQVLLDCGYRCQLTGCGEPAVEVHHRTPISEGGEVFDRDNLVALCRRHHREAHLPGMAPLPALRGGRLPGLCLVPHCGNRRVAGAV